MPAIVLPLGAGGGGRIPACRLRWPRLMFERFKFAKKLWNANKAASRVMVLIRPALFTVVSPGGGFDPKLKSDTFVVGYIYGVITACADGNQQQNGLLIQQVFEQLFPNHGKSLTEYCTSQALRKNPDFMQATRVGFGEMVELANSEGHEPLSSLLLHVCKHYQS